VKLSTTEYNEFCTKACVREAFLILDIFWLNLFKQSGGFNAFLTYADKGGFFYQL